jgi:hypothetical protein
MKAIQLTVAAALLVGALAFAADTPQPAQDAKMQEAMKAWMKYATPGEPHKVLKDLTGKYKYTSKFWQSAEAKPEESKGTSTMKLVLGGRYLQHETKGKAMGQPFEGLGYIAYDNIKEKYETLWMDNMGTGIIHGSGTFDTASRTLKDTGEYTDPSSEKRVNTYRGEWKLVDKNSHVYSMWTTGPDGKEFKQMEMAYQRAK